MGLLNADLTDSARGREGSGAGNSAEQNHPLVVVAIDDDPGILGFYQTVMSGMGMRFESSTDPRQALDLVATHDPSLVILDLTMPGIDGMELLHPGPARAGGRRSALGAPFPRPIQRSI